MCSVYSIGAIGLESNGAIHSSVSDLLEPYGVAANRIYINFFDMPRANVGWNKKTFAGFIARIIGRGKIGMLNFMKTICCMCPLSAINGRQPYAHVLKVQNST